MAETTTQVDPSFLSALKSDISGKYWAQVEKFTPEQIEREFRNIVQDPHLVEKEGVMANLMFVVRKREIRPLHDDVVRVLRGSSLKPGAHVSTLKTLYAIGDEKDRDQIDQLLVSRLRRRRESADGLHDCVHLPACERVGGPKTLAALREFHAEARDAQKQAEAQEPPDFAGIKKLDKLRSTLVAQEGVLSRKLDILGKAESDRATAMAEQYLGRRSALEAWAYKYLVDHASPAAIDAVRAYATRGFGNLMPPRGLSTEQRSELLRDIQLRGICLLEAMDAQLTPEESKQLADNSATLEARKSFFRPEYDWEDVLDRR